MGGDIIYDIYHIWNVHYYGCSKENAYEVAGRSCFNKCLSVSRSVHTEVAGQGPGPES